MGASVDLRGAALVRAPEGLTPYSWRGVCRVPGCRRPATDPHHVVPRPRLGGPVRFVLLDGLVMPNVAGLCRRHHDKLTKGESMMIFRDAWWWYRSAAREVQMLPFDSAGVIAALGGRHCPHCGRPKPKPNPYTNQATDKRRVSIDVPVGAEDGAEILEVLTEQVGELLGLDNTHTPASRYHTITAALALALERRGNGNASPARGSGELGGRPFDPENR